MYLVTKTIHVVAIISWMAGLLYLFRLFIYDTERGQNDRNIHDLMLLMQRRLYKVITLPAMIVAFITGIALIIMNPEFMRQGWFHMKLTSVIGLKVLTIYAGRTHKKLSRNEFTLSSRTLRIVNEIPTLLMIVVVAMVIMRPF